MGYGVEDTLGTIRETTVKFRRGWIVICALEFDSRCEHTRGHATIKYWLLGVRMHS